MGVEPEQAWDLLEGPDYWKVELLLGGLHAELGIGPRARPGPRDTLAEENWGGGDSDPGWIGDLPEAEE